jgi:1-acyl-sn-glycerol-3-phosphate acyltransferase
MSSWSAKVRSILAEPTWPSTLDRPAPERNLGLDYDTAWARRPVARHVRATVIETVTRPLTQLVARPRLYGLDKLETTDGPVILVANHASHLDTAVVLSMLPAAIREHTVVAAAADYFFDRKWKASLWALLLGTIPVERTRVNRRSADLAVELINDGWNLLIFPEGGRTEDGWGQEFSPASAAYLAKRCGVPVVPMHLRGMRPLFAKGRSTISPGTVELRVGDPLRPRTQESGREEDARRFSERIESAVALLADEAETDWWQARQHLAASTAPELRGPEASEWRRAWSLPESQRTHRAPHRRRTRPW